MIKSRLNKYEDRKAQNRLTIAVIGSLGVLVFLAIFGLKMLVGFSLLVDRIRGNSPAAQTASNVILAPVLDQLPQATHSATLTISGKGTPGLQLTLYLNEKEHSSIPVSADGTYSIPDIAVEEGLATFYTILSDESGNTSDPSNVTSTTIDRTPPSLAVSKPEEGAKIQDGTRKTTVEGVTDRDCSITINNRIVVVRNDGVFTYAMPLSDGENTLHIVATDPAGNTTTADRRVSYQN